MSRQAHVSLGGSPLEDAILDQVEVHQVLNGHWQCTLTCHDTLDHPIPGEDVLGQPCRISNVAEDGTEQVSFEGIVIEVSLTREVWGSSTAVVRAYSPSWVMDRSRRNRYFPTASLAPVAAELTAACRWAAIYPASSLRPTHSQNRSTSTSSTARQTGSFCCVGPMTLAAGCAPGWVRLN